MKARAALALAPAALLPLMLTASPASAASSTTYTVPLSGLNNSGATGTAQLTLAGTSLHVVIDAHGLVPNSPHAQHIHGDTSGKVFECPDAAQQVAADANKDGHLSTTELAGFYGPVMYSLTTTGDYSMGSALAVTRFPVADAQGNLHYDRTITLPAKVAATLSDLHVVEHGVDYNHDGSYDGTAKSDLDPALPAEATDPADCGALHLAQVSHTPLGGVATGTGSGNGPEQLPAFIVGAAALTGAVTLMAVRRRAAAAPASGSDR